MSAENNTKSAHEIAAMEMLGDAINSLAEGFVLFDSDRRLVICNQALRDMSEPLGHLLVPGVTREHIVRETAKHGSYQNDTNNEEAWVSRQLMLGEQYTRDFEMTKRDGTCHLVSVYPTERGGLVITCRDATEQKKTEDLISQVLEACQVPIQMTSLKTGEILFSTSATKELFGEVKNSREYYVDNKGRPELMKELREKGWYKDRVAQYVGRDGNPFWNAQSARLLEFRGEEVIVSNTRDLTEELALQEELKSQREQLFQNEKMSALGELLAGVAHELNNPLSIVVGHSQMLLEQTSDPDMEYRVQKISAAADRCAKIVKTFLAIARQQPEKMDLTDLNSVISSSIDLASYSHSHGGVVINRVLDENLPSVLADGNQITQVVLNLIINAEQAMNTAGIGDCVTVTTRTAHSADGDQCVEICIEDNGPGIPESVRPRIFEPFFTTKATGEGTGIGLAFCHRTIMSHSGQIWLDNEHESGSRFVIQLPVTDATQEQPPDVEETQNTVLNLKALVVDDEPEVAELIAEILELEGFVVDIANSGSQAADHLETTTYDLLLSDLNMPELDGHGLYDLLKSDHPETLEVTGFITGDTLGPRSQVLLREADRPHLEKPVTPQGLRDFVAEILNSAD